MKLVNLTPHEITIIPNREYSLTLPAEEVTRKESILVLPSEGVARAEQEDKILYRQLIDGMLVPIVATTFGAPINLPDPEEGIGYVVSLATAQAAKSYGRTTEDLYVTSQPIRDENGKIVGCGALAQI